MRADSRVLEFLNEQLTAELTAINQYFLHAKMQQNFGWLKLASHTRAESVDEMRHAEVLTDRILFLEGLPNYQRLYPLRIGRTVTQMFESDMAVETEAVDRLRRFSTLPIAVGFGIKTPAQAADIARIADAAVVGSAIVDRLALNLDPDNNAKPGLVEAVLTDVRALAEGVRGARRKA